MSEQQTIRPARPTRQLENVVIRFAGDSGDGMQITGSQFTSTSAVLGNDVSTLPDFPAEIRAPAGTLPGVSGFQIHFASSDIYTPGDKVDVLVAMNPAALRVNIADLKPNGLLIVNLDSFGENDLAKAGLTANPLDDGSLAAYRLVPVELARLTRVALRDSGLDTRAVERCKNFFALGMMYHLYQRPTRTTERWLDERFARSPALLKANRMALAAGVAFCEATELFHETYIVPPARLAPGRYRNISGNEALALGMVAASRRAGLPLFLGSYPITPASDILHELSRFKNFPVSTFQAEDEIAGIASAIGAAFGGAIGLTTTSGPGLALKSEALNLAVMVELPLVVVDVQRGGPSTGLPTKTEQADLLQAMFGRSSESPVPVLAPATPGDCFHIAFEAVRLAIAYMTPVIVLSDGYLANGAEPWRIPVVEELPKIDVRFRTDPHGFAPFARDARTLARPWAVPGTPGLEHRIGGIEKEDVTGNVSYDPLNHEHMVRLRSEKVQRIAQDIPDLDVLGGESGAVLVVGWGSTYGAITAAVLKAQQEGRAVSAVHLRHLNPLPRNLGTLLSAFRRVLVPEMNLGQLALLLRARYLVDAVSLSKVQGKPFNEDEIHERIVALLETV
jgi:2-oxoglutarate/2-oxoacid ferredoxin oxidoreductase subunit alpha